MKQDKNQQKKLNTKHMFCSDTHTCVKIELINAKTNYKTA